MTKLRKMGTSSLGILIPKFIIESLNWKDDDNFLISFDNSGVKITKEEKRDE